ncbi:hypothetical protein LA080_011473 [Diaporthe eres]|nr:hypothetical protein LA080_011473 [Diaporthe eres]
MSTMADSKRRLLPALLKPNLYDICLEPDFQADTFSGITSIHHADVYHQDALQVHQNLGSHSRLPRHYTGS